jgi:hypothetical protein
LSKPIYNIYPTLLDAFAWYKRSEDEGALQEFLDKVNRVKSEPSDPMLRGIAFEALVDDLIFSGHRLAIPEVQVHDVECPSSIPNAFADRLRGAVRQVDVEVVVDTEHGPVRLYGKVDEIVADCAFDIKTTGKYEFPKYLHHFQHPLYLEALRPYGINQCLYLVTDFKDVYEEPYSWTRDGRDRLIGEVAHLVEFLENNRARITDRKVFGLPAEIATL